MLTELTASQVAQIIILTREIDRAEAELRAFIEAMDEPALLELTALMWIGRGSFEVDEWDEALRTAEAQSTTPTADYLIGTPHMSDHLEAGLEAFGIDPTDAEDDIIKPV